MGYSEYKLSYGRKIFKKLLVGCKKNLVHQKIPYIVRLRHLKNHIEAVDLYLMNWHLSRLNIEWISVVSLSVIPWLIDLSELSHVMKNWSLTLIPRNSGLVPVNLPNSSLTQCVSGVILMVWLTGTLFQMGMQSMRIIILNIWNEFMKFWDGWYLH